MNNLRMKIIKTVVAVIALTVGVSAQAETFSRTSPGSSSVTTYEDHTVTFTVRGSGLGWPDNWDFAKWYIDGWAVDKTDMSGQTDSASFSKTFTEQGNYEVSVYAEWTDIGVLVPVRIRHTSTITWNVSVNSCDPIVSCVSPDSDITVTAGFGDTFVFQARDPGGDLARAVWFFNGQEYTSETISGSTAQGQKILSFNNPGTYDIGVRVYDTHNFTDYTSWRVNVESANVAPVANNGGPYTGQVGQSIQFNGFGSYDPDGSIASYDWSFGDGSVGTGTDPTHSYAAAGTYTVTLKVTDNNSGSDTDTTTVEITQPVNQPPNAYTDGPYSGKVGESILFDGSFSQDPDGTIVSYEWDFGDGSSTTGDTIPRHTYTAAGTYTVTLTVTDNDGASDTTTTTVEITQTDNQPPTANANGPYVGQPGQLLQFDASDSSDQDGNIDSYEWDFGDGRKAVGVNPTHSYARQGSYLVSLTVRDDQGGVDTYITSADISNDINSLPNSNGYIDIAAGHYHSLALKKDGSIVGWGNNEFGQAEPPEGNDFVAIAAGSFHSLALREDGSIVGWGDNQYGQADPPAGNDFIAIAAGRKHSLALKSDGSIIAWGDNANGQTDMPSGNDFIAIAAGAGHSLALKSDGSILAWGRNTVGQSDAPAGKDFVAIAAGGQFNLALKKDGSIVAWGGKNTYGQANPPSGNDFVAISAGRFHALALKSDGSIVTWGDNRFGQATPPDGNDFIDVACGGSHSLALTYDGTIVAWGDNLYGQASPPEADGN